MEQYAIDLAHLLGHGDLPLCLDVFGTCDASRKLARYFSLCHSHLAYGNLVSLEHKYFLERDISPLEEGARINDLNGEHSWRRIGLAHFKTQIGPRFSQM